MIEWTLALWIVVNGQLAIATGEASSLRACVEAAQEHIEAADFGGFKCTFRQVV